jgi:hypothetical protein
LATAAMAIRRLRVTLPDRGRSHRVSAGKRGRRACG